MKSFDGISQIKSSETTKTVESLSLRGKGSDKSAEGSMFCTSTCADPQLISTLTHPVSHMFQSGVRCLDTFTPSLVRMYGGLVLHETL